MALPTDSDSSRLFMQLELVAAFSAVNALCAWSFKGFRQCCRPEACTIRCLADDELERVLSSNRFRAIFTNL